MQRKIFSLLVLTVILTLVSNKTHAQTNEGKLAGQWTNENKTRVIQINSTNHGFDAIIIDAPDKELVGQKQMTGLRYSNGLYNGSVILIKRNTSIPCTVVVINDSIMKISVRPRSQTWKRIK